jgi:starch synthase
MSKLRILEVASEVAPFARTGGLGDVLGALPRALAVLGHEVKVCFPHYGFLKQQERFAPLSPVIEVPVAGAGRTVRISSLRDQRRRIEHLALGNDEYFNRPEFYRDPKTGTDYIDNDERFVFFNRAVLEAVKALDWKPDIIHVHDWQAGLIPAYLRTVYAIDPFFADTKSVLTIHNLGYQGLFPGPRFPKLGLPEKLFYAMSGPFEFFGKVNYLKGAILFADRLTTVSPRYAEEIQAGDEFGCGLEGVLTERTADLTGILNGVDYTVWSPTRDKMIPYRYTIPNLSGKKKCKIELLNASGLPIRESAPLIGLVTRLTAQKGLDLIEEAADDLLAMNVQLIVLGSGDTSYQTMFQKLERKYPDKVRAYLAFDDTLAHQIEAASDIFLMPSRWEPCGLNQLYSLKYGTVPVVRAVGGLADTVVDYDPAGETGTGFVFTEYEADDMLAAIKRALALFPRKRAWMKLMKNGMQQDFSWDRSARRYAELFEQLAAQ